MLADFKDDVHIHSHMLRTQAADGRLLNHTKAPRIAARQTHHARGATDTTEEHKHQSVIRPRAKTLRQQDRKCANLAARPFTDNKGSAGPFQEFTSKVAVPACGHLCSAKQHGQLIRSVSARTTLCCVRGKGRECGAARCDAAPAGHESPSQDEPCRAALAGVALLVIAT